MITRRWILFGAGGAAWAAPPENEGPGRMRVLVVTTPGVEAYRQAVDGIVANWDAVKASAVMVELDSDGKKLAEGLAGGPRLAIAVGVEARQALAKAPVPVISTMLLVADADESSARGDAPANVAGTVYLDVELPRIAAELGPLFPGKKRMGILVDGDKRSAPNHTVLAQLAQQGFEPQVAVCARKKELSKTLLGLRGKTDFVLCLPSSSIYDGESVKALIEASLESRLPVVGFSAGFVRAGAPVAVFPDFHDVGAQVVEMTRALLTRESFAADQTPRKLTVSTNPRSARLMGLKLPK